MPYLTITHLVGKPDPTTGGWLHPRPPSARVREQLEQAARSYERVRVRLRPNIQAAPMTHEVRTMCGYLLDQLASTGEVRITMDYGRVDPATRRYVGAEVKGYKPDVIYEATASEAFRLLNTPPYHYLFEEVMGEGADAPPPLNLSRPADASQVAEVQAQNRYLQSELDQLKQALFALQQQQQAAASSAKAKQKPRTLKDLDGPPDEGQE